MVGANIEKPLSTNLNPSHLPLSGKIMAFR